MIFLSKIDLKKNILFQKSVKNRNIKKNAGKIIFNIKNQITKERRFNI